MKTTTTTKERPILFSGPMVLALLNGTKTQTRRILKPQPANLAGPNFDGLWSDTIDPVTRYFTCPYGASGDRLWVRETHAVRPTDIPEEKWVVYRADNESRRVGIGEDETAENWQILGCEPRQHSGEIDRWQPSIFMPRWASRITLKIESVRVERLQDISEEDAKEEGCELPPCTYLRNCRSNSCPRHGRLDRWSNAYRTLWESINGKGSWALNSWVWAIAFKRV